MMVRYQLFFVLLFVAPATIRAQTTTPVQLAEFQSPVAIKLTAKDSERDGYRRITVMANKRTTRITPKNPVACVPSDKQGRLRTGLWATIDGMQLDPSRCFFRGVYVANGNPHSLLAFLSEGYASDAAPILLLGFHADGTPYKVLERDEFDPFAFETIAAGGFARFIGYPTLSQVMYGDGGNGSKAPYATTYDPRSVYIIAPNLPAQYSLAASKAYNQQHYVWAGPTVSEQIAVIYNYPGRPKPFSVPAKQAEGLFAQFPTEKHKP